jgi:hypothetical protein
MNAMSRHVLLRTTFLTAITQQQDELAFTILYQLMCEAHDSVQRLAPQRIALQPFIAAWSDALLLDQPWQRMDDLRQAYCMLWSLDERPCTYRSMVVGITYELRRALVPLREALTIDDSSVSMPQAEAAQTLVELLIGLWAEVRDRIVAHDLHG